MLEEKTELSYEAPGYRLAFYVVFAVSLAYLILIFVRG